MMDVTDIFIDGTDMGRGCVRVFLNGKECRLRQASFKILLGLCVASPKWVSNLGTEETIHRYLYHLRQEIKKIGLDLMIENGRWEGYEGEYRIITDRISINSVALSKHPDFEVRKMVN